MTTVISIIVSIGVALVIGGLLRITFKYIKEFNRVVEGKPKPISEWFEEHLGSSYKEQALTNMRGGNRIANSLSEALRMGFIWHESPEGAMYWINLIRTIEIDERYENEYDEQ